MSRAPRRCRGLHAAAALALAVTFAPAAALATPTRWSLAKDGRAYADDLAARQAEALLHAQDRVSDGEALVPAEDSLLQASRARETLLAVHADRSPRGFLRLLLAKTDYVLHRYDEAAALYESVVADASVAVPVRASAYDELAIAYARLGRVDDEIAAYDAAIAFEPDLDARSLYLSNQAEAFMVKGDIQSAVRGYRAALVVLGQLDQHGLAPTTLWSLGVALDRSGDLGAALDTIAFARGIDPDDKRIHGPTWFFVPDYDEDYYDALGNWLVARRADDTDIRMAAYEQAIVSWKSYLVRAPESDLYRRVASARLTAIESEYDAFAKKARTPTPVDAR
ncbi:MAG TPA: hypothetical protein VL400_23995 [Polyangiaceae bacterium]|nr:hypothetical protein [Polyangiaceae bacterium]